MGLVKFVSLSVFCLSLLATLCQSLEKRRHRGHGFSNKISRRKFGHKLDVHPLNDLLDIAEDDLPLEVLSNGRIKVAHPGEHQPVADIKVDEILKHVHGHHHVVDLSDMGIVALPKKVKGKVMKNPLDMMPQHMNPVRFLERFGYLKKTRDEKHSMKATVKAVKHFQKMYHMKPSGMLDPETITAMMSPRCGMEDAVPPPEDVTTEEEATEGPHSREKRFITKGYKWRKTDLTYHFRNLSATSALSPLTQKQALIRGLNFWAEKSRLTFREASPGESADINIMFTKGVHGDGSQNAFDGPSGVLAHAYFPESGEAHFDDDELWTDNESRGVNLMIVAAHEFGHAMGLSHSDMPGALMAPFYQGYEANFKLRDDDVNGIQSLYGLPGSVGTFTAAPTTTTTTTPAPPPPASPAPNACSVTFKAITQTHDHRVYVFNGDYMWRISDYGLDQGFPMPIRDLFENAPSNIDAAFFSWDSYYTYFFKGKQVWRYYGFMLMGTGTLTSYYSPSFIKAAVVTPSGSICLVQGTYCYLFDEWAMNTVGYPSNFTSFFPGSITTFDSLLTLTGESDLYFFFGNYYDKYSTYYKGLLAGYPRTKAGPWMGPVCGGSAYSPR